MVIFDASTLILLAKIELLELVLDRSGWETAIPDEVHKECCRGRTLDALLIQQLIERARIKVIRSSNSKLARKIRTDFHLGKGEAEVIALAVEHQAARLIGIDDKSGINACKLLGLPFTTAVAILVRSSEQGWLTRGEALIKLQALSGHGRYKPAIIEDARSRMEARR